MPTASHPFPNYRLRIRRRGRHASVPAVTLEDPLLETQDGYAHNVFVGTSLRRLDKVQMNTLEDAAVVQFWGGSVTCPRCAKEDEPSTEHLRHHLKHYLVSRGTPSRVPAPGAPVTANLRLAAELLGLGKGETEILRFLLAAHHGPRLSEVLEPLGELTMTAACAVIAAATRLPVAKVTPALRPDGRLVSSGLVTIDGDRSPFCRKVYLRPLLLDLLTTPGLDREAFLRAFLPPAAKSTLALTDFADQRSLETARDLLAGALRTGARGINILLAGPTGVGKSEAARLLGQLTGAKVYAVGTADEQGDSASPTERCAALRLASQVAPRGESILLFDELEDLFRWELSFFTASRAAPQMSKQWFGLLLEENPHPTIWCTNRVDGIDPAFLRRFTCAVELEAPGARQRAEVLVHHVGPDGGLTPADCRAIAQRFETSPAQLGSAVRGARLLSSGGPVDRPTVEGLLGSVHKLITGEDARLKPVFEPSGYRLDALHCGEDLEALAAQVAAFQDGPSPGISLCLYGPPGTGKSEYVKYLAWRCNRPLVYRRVSDLVSPYVGMTERNLARAFAEARADGSLLLFDEADSFLRDRQGAERSWEVTQVNEFLQQLEVFPGIVVCTTNLWRNLDEAALRRFVFKLELKFPAPGQVVRLFETFFPEAYRAAGEAAVEAALRGFTTLAPGDFAAVARRVRALRAEPDLAALARMLGCEVAVKREAPIRSVGFGV